MYCPFCQAEDTKVIDSRLVADGSQTRRRRSCEICHSRFTTFETADLALPRVIKSNGDRQPFNGSKLKKGMLRALEKRPLSLEEIDIVFGKILKEIRDITQKHSGYFTIIKIEEDLKASADIFTIDPIKYKISEKIKKSFDPKRIFNPGKMYSGI